MFDEVFFDLSRDSDLEEGLGFFEKLMWLPIISKTTSFSFPLLDVRVLDRCCRKMIFDSVGRSIKTVSILGKSTPSLNRSTENNINCAGI